MIEKGRGRVVYKSKNEYTMKTLVINSVQFQLALKGFKDWLKTLNYSDSVIKNYPNYARELLHYLEFKSINEMSKINTSVLQCFIEYIQVRKNETSGAGLSASSINGIMNGISKFLHYLRLTKDIHLDPHFKRLSINHYQRTILTQDEVGALLMSINSDFNPVAKRNKAILCILYSCGLRRNELVQLNVEDISFARKTLHVKHGKGRKERLIPLVEPFTACIKDYVRNCRDALEKIATGSNNALFIDVEGLRISGDYLENLIKKIIRESNVETLQDKRITLHSFRHSVATHLLQKGMDIEAIAQLLGHKSLDSTMIYTHIVEQMQQTENIEQGTNE